MISGVKPVRNAMGEMFDELMVDKYVRSNETVPLETKQFIL